MAKNWMKAAGQNGIPTAFIVNKEGKIAWIGHPGRMDEPLDKIVAGPGIYSSPASEHKKAMEERVKFMKLQSEARRGHQG